MLSNNKVASFPCRWQETRYSSSGFAALASLVLCVVLGAAACGTESDSFGEEFNTGENSIGTEALGSTAIAYCATAAQACSCSADADKDGLANCYENAVCAMTPNLGNLGAHPCQQDIFVEVDWLVDSNKSPTYNLPMSRQAIETSIQLAEDQLGLCLHIDNGEGIWGCTDLLSGGGLAAQPAVGASHSRATPVVPTAKGNSGPMGTNYFTPSRKGFFYWAVSFGGGGGNGGTKNGFKFNGKQGAAFMHELGHVLGLEHAGPVKGPNFKPNYPSLMNYAFNYGMQDGNTTVVQYSAYDLAALDPQNLIETDGMRYKALNIKIQGSDLDWFKAEFPCLVTANGDIDWNCDGVITSTPVAAMIQYKDGKAGRDTTSQSDYASAYRDGNTSTGQTSKVKSQSTPSAVDANGVLYLFSRGSDDGLYYQAYDGTTFVAPKKVDLLNGVKLASSPSAVYYADAIRVYFTAAGSGELVRAKFTGSGNLTLTYAEQWPDASSTARDPHAFNSVDGNQLYMVGRMPNTNQVMFRFHNLSNGWSAWQDTGLVSQVAPAAVAAAVPSTNLFGPTVSEIIYVVGSATGGACPMGASCLYQAMLSSAGIGSAQTFFKQNPSMSMLRKVDNAVRPTVWFSDNAKKSSAGRLHVWSVGEPKNATFQLAHSSFDVASQKSFSWPIATTMPVGAAVDLFKGQRIGILEPLAQGQQNWPQADGVHETLMTGTNDVATLLQNYPTFVKNLNITTAAPGNVDSDYDGSPDNTDSDDDNDAVPDTSDTCRTGADKSNMDSDNDGIGDVCDIDDDNDGCYDLVDNNPNTACIQSAAAAMLKFYTP